MGRTNDHRNICACSGSYLDSHRARHLKSDKHQNWLVMQSSGQRPFKDQVVWYNNNFIYQQDTNEEVIDDEYWWDNYDTDKQYQELEIQFPEEYKYPQYLKW